MSESLLRARGIFSNVPSLAQWSRLPRLLNRKEKIAFALLFLVFLVSGSILLNSLYLSQTSIKPANGGEVKEGVVGHPRFVNPVLASSDPDRDLVQLTFSGLMKYNEKGEIVKDLAQDYQSQQEKGIYDIGLKEDIFWSDGQPITADDVVFTVETIQDPNYKSPERTNWLGVTAEALSDKRVRFELQKPYFPFEERLTLKIIPRHIFKNVTAEEFALSPYNLQQVVCSGPYLISEIEQDDKGKITGVVLERNKSYHGKKPYLDQIQFSFFDKYEEASQAFNKGLVNSLLLSDPMQSEQFVQKGAELYTARSPRYFGVFFNPQKNELFQKEEVRKALWASLDKTAVKNEAINGRGEEVVSPVLPSLYGFQEPEQEAEVQPETLLVQAGLVKENGRWVDKPEPEFVFESRLEKGDEGDEVENLQKCLSQWEEVYPDKEVTAYFGSKTEEAVIRFQEKYKEDILDPWGFDEGTGIVSETTREKLNQVCNRQEGTPLKLTITTLDQGFLLRTAQAIKKQWEALGIEVVVEKHEFSKLSRDAINQREYEILLFGELLGMVPDPFPFWHSSSIQDPGLNLSFYQSDEADNYLEKARAANDYEEFKEHLFKFQEQFVKDRPAILLYSPELCYVFNSHVENVKFEVAVDPSQRFSMIEEWYVKTKRNLR